MTENIRSVVVSLIESFRSSGECEFVADFALQFPLTIFLGMMGLPFNDRLWLRGLVEVYATDPDASKKSQVEEELHRYLDGWIEKRIEQPGDDGISMVSRLTVNGRPYTRDEMIATCTLLLHAGLDTVANTLGFIALDLARNPDHREYIRRHRDRMHDIIQELLRRYTVANQSRVVTGDVVYNGVSLKAGDMVTLPGSLFNLDKELLPDADRVNFERKARHVTFGSGPHTCAGALLARREFAIFLEEWLDRIPDFEIDPQRPPRMNAGLTNQVHELWLRWNRSHSPATAA